MFRIKQPGTFTIPMLILVLILTLMLPGSESVAALPSTVSSNKALIRHYYDLFNSRSWDSLTDVLPPDVVDHDPAPHEGSGSDGIKQTLMAITSAFPDMTITVDDLVVEGSKVADRVQVKGTHKGTFFGLAATNKAVSFETMTLWHISNNKVTEMWHSD